MNPGEITTAAKLNNLLGRDASETILELTNEVGLRSETYITQERAAFALLFIINRTAPKVLIEVLKDKAPAVMESLINVAGNFDPRNGAQIPASQAVKGFKDAISIVPRAI